MYLHIYRHILIATDGSRLSEKAVRQGLALAKAVGAQATIITVTEPFPIIAGDFLSGGPAVEHFESSQEQIAHAHLSAAMEGADEIGIAADTVHVADAQPAEAILETARSRNCDLIVMGSHGRRGLDRLLLGSKTYEVVSHGHIPVLVVR